MQLKSYVSSLYPNAYISRNV